MGSSLFEDVLVFNKNLVFMNFQFSFGGEFLNLLNINFIFGVDDGKIFNFFLFGGNEL